MATKPTFGRRFVDISHKARGRTPFRYEFEIIPYCVAEVPQGHERVLFVWERGTKLFVTDAEAVNTKTRVVFWKQYLRQTITVYKAGNSIVKKEYTFKIQSVKDTSSGEEERTTIGKTQIDLAVYCTGQTDPQPQELFLQLKPHGKLKVSIKACWMKDAKIDADTMTEISGPTEDYGQEEYDEVYDEQDLSGFDHVNGSSVRSHDGGAEESSDGMNGGGKRSSRRGGGRSRSRTRGGGGRYRDEGGGDLPRDPDEMRRIQEVENEVDPGQQHDAEEYNRMVAEITAQVRTEVEPLQSAGAFCCCFPRKQMINVDVQEVASLLAKKPNMQMSHVRQ